MPKTKIAAKLEPNKTIGKISTSKTIKKTAPAEDGMKRDSAKMKKKWRAGTVCLREIKRYQKGTENLLPRAPF